jgi:hypothetical protein
MGRVYIRKHSAFQHALFDGIVKKVRMLRCAASFAIAAYVYIRLRGGGWLKPAPSPLRLACGAFYDAIQN